jgi:hypothetical protein
MAPEVDASCRRERNQLRLAALDTLARCYDGAECQSPLFLYMYELHPDEP